ncbi:flagellar basal body rod protein FlgC [Sporanaerobium hydrogeniformans]|uniref:Flagellar basal body rod protein FlgC n=1 Tax=Sporanaerobium hydrogeniformans TaxID=3072179 RepID=A0AC61DGK5_9FIRM|nr:flagellar basal body rod protein FlgC [Sporanaerobium hydrogeniformans]PHV71737.1 flagellar basal body rod protein FlgC [Sporanaerobium hydrogeniformans]
MSFFGSMDTSTSGLTAQRLRLDIISQNIANANTTRTPEGGPYRRKTVLFESITNQSNNFGDILNQKINSQNNGVRVSQIVEDNSPFPVVYDPTHPDANAQGYVEQPNVNIVTEMVNMISASRSYEANVTAFNNMKSMINSALAIGK